MFGGKSIVPLRLTGSQLSFNFTIRKIYIGGIYNEHVNVEQDTIPKAVREAVNNVSGKYAAPFWDTLYETAELLATVKNIRNVLAALYFADKQDEAMLLLHSVYDLLGMEYPKDFLIVEQNEDARRILINEFLLDIDDLMYDYQVEK